MTNIVCSPVLDFHLDLSAQTEDDLLDFKA